MREPAVTRVEPTRGWAPLQLKELWEYRKLLYFLALRDVKVRYKQTALGATWAVLQPLLTWSSSPWSSAGLAGSRRTGCPTRFALAALVPWTYFSPTPSRRPPAAWSANIRPW